MCNFRVSIETRFRESTYLLQARSELDRWWGPVPTLFPADAGTPSIAIDIAGNGTCETSQNGQGRRLQGEHDLESAMADRPPDNGLGNRRPPPLDTAGQTVDVAVRWARETAGSGRVSAALVRVSKHRLGSRRADAIADRPPDTGDPRPTIRHGRMIGRHLSDLSCLLWRQTEVAAFALTGQCSGVTRVISARRQKHLPPLSPTT